MKNEIKIVIGSWGSYNECNERALGSKWLTLNDFNSWNEIKAELIQEGFKLDGIDEELFIQDIEGISDSSVNWDCVNPEQLFNTLDESGILRDEYKYEVFSAFVEVELFDEFEDRVEKYGDCWDDDVYIYRKHDWYDLGYNLLHDCYSIPDFLEDYIDYKRYGEELTFQGFKKYSGGIIEIR